MQQSANAAAFILRELALADISLFNSKMPATHNYEIQIQMIAVKALMALRAYAAYTFPASRFTTATENRTSRKTAQEARNRWIKHTAEHHCR
jgi:hypothetical protein